MVYQSAQTNKRARILNQGDAFFPEFEDKFYLAEKPLEHENFKVQIWKRND
jgi:hypothetical protein